MKKHLLLVYPRNADLLQALRLVCELGGGLALDELILLGKEAGYAG